MKKLSHRAMGSHENLPIKKRRVRSLFTVLLIFIVSVEILSQPRWLFNLATHIQPGAIYTLNSPALSADANRSRQDLPAPPPAPPKVIALTIDDGPSSATADILSVLERYDVKATFFNISGHTLTYEDILRQTVAAGHELGNHLTADEPSIRLSTDAFKADLLAAERLFSTYLQPTLGGHQQSLRWFRPGMGFYTANMVKMAEHYGYRLVLGSVFPYDTHISSSWFASAFILNTVEPGDIIVLHDGEDHRGQRTATTLEKILPRLQARGYKITTLTEAEKMHQS